MSPRPDSLAYLFGLEQFGVKFGLENIRALLRELGHPERAFTAVHVGGTNGKGSVTAMIESALRAAGHRTGRYTSPHLRHLTERFVVHGTPVTEEALSSIVAEIRDAIEQMHTRGGLRAHPTFFEATTAAAFELFRRAKVEIAVCEVGLGGRLDATNVLMPAVSVITSIGLDHQQYLGNTLSAIAFEKAGIIKPGVPVVVGDVDSEALHVIAQAAHERGAPLAIARDDVTLDFGLHAHHTEIRLRTRARDYGTITLPLRGAHQVANAMVAIRALEELDVRGISVPASAAVEGLSSVQWPGRLQHVALSGGRGVLLDAAHNPQGAQALGSYLARHTAKRPLVFAAMCDKDAAGILSALAPVVSAIVITRASNPRSSDPSLLTAIAARVAPDVAAIVSTNPADALANAWRISPEVVVAGSIFLLGDVLEVLERS